MLVYWMWLTMLQGVTPRQMRNLLEHFSNPEHIYNATDYSGVENITPEMVCALSDKNIDPAKTRINACRRKGIGIITLGDTEYPDRLRFIADPPPVLYYKGVLPDFSAYPAIGVVGTRKATPYGINMAKQISEQIARCGGLVVSGGAHGVDAAALQGALNAKAPSVTVLGCGVDVDYPAANRPLFRKLENFGCLISEYPPGTKPAPWQFPARNRIISGISNGVLVIEAPEKSGALITAKDALEQGRDVFVIPGNIDMPTCAGSNGLLREGAAAVFSGWDVLREYAADYPNTLRQSPVQSLSRTEETPAAVAAPDKKSVDIPQTNAYSGKDNGPTDLTETEQKLLSCMTRTPRLIDEVILDAGVPAGAAMGVITKLALKGLVVHHPGKRISAK